MKKTAHYILTQISHSYNIFYYDFPGDTNLYVKIVPRFLTNPLFVGYMVPQIATEEETTPFIDKLKQAILT